MHQLYDPAFADEIPYNLSVVELEEGIRLTTQVVGVPLRARCVTCFSGELDWAPSSGNATLYSFVLMHQLYDEAFAAEIPYNIAVVETEEGVRLTSQVVDCPNERLEIGMPLEVTFERMSDAVAVPKFRPRA